LRASECGVTAAQKVFEEVDLLLEPLHLVFEQGKPLLVDACNRRGLRFLFRFGLQGHRRQSEDVANDACCDRRGPGALQLLRRA
jgi:hypothetical protein